MAIWRGARPGKGRGQKRTKFPWREVGEGTVRRQSSGEPRPGIPDLSVSGRQPPTSYSSLALTTPPPADKDFPPLVSLKTLLDTILLSQRPKPFLPRQFLSGAATAHDLSDSPCCYLPKPCPPWPPPSVLSTADLILSPACPMKPFPLRPLPAAPFLQPRLREGGLVKEGGGRLRGEGVLTLTLGGFKEGDREGRRDTEAEREG